MKIFNTMSKTKEEFVPVDEKEVKIYACGPTVYNFIHIGNARPLCVFDVLRRYMEYKGYNVKFVQNFTDIDDKIINRANEEGLTFEEVSKKYIEEFWTDAHGLNFKDATIHPKATENIDEIIDIIKSLEKKGYAYAVNGDVYFRTLKFKEYGKLSHQPIDDLVSGARIAVGDIKENPLDFALWKGAKEGEPYWDSPWGKGRPGWLMSMMGTKWFVGYFPANPLPYLDCCVTVLILTAQTLSAMKKWDCWIAWLFVNVANLTLYLKAGLVFMPVVSMLYLVNGIWALVTWFRLYRKNA